MDRVLIAMPKKEDKRKLAAYWASSCGGCDVGLLGLHERLLELIDFASIVFWPAATDFKYEDLRSYGDGEIDVTFFNGGIRTSENAEMAELLRRKSEVLVAYGSCAHLGGIPGLANLSERGTLFDTVYRENPTTKNPANTVPKQVSEGKFGELELPGVNEKVGALSDIVPVDYSVPGCPPPPEITEDFLDLLLENDLPETGSVIAGGKTVCDECDREWNQEAIEELKPPGDVNIDPDECLLDQGIICLGPATRSGCDASCPSVNRPCRGCFGPPEGVEDQGAEMLNSLASILQIGEEGTGLEQERELLGALPDPLGTFYSFALPVSIFGGRVEDGGTNEHE